MFYSNSLPISQASIKVGKCVFIVNCSVIYNYNKYNTKKKNKKYAVFNFKIIVPPIFYIIKINCSNECFRIHHNAIETIILNYFEIWLYCWYKKEFW